MSFQCDGMWESDPAVMLWLSCILLPCQTISTFSDEFFQYIEVMSGLGESEKVDSEI